LASGDLVGVGDTQFEVVGVPDQLREGGDGVGGAHLTNRPSLLSFTLLLLISPPLSLHRPFLRPTWVGWASAPRIQAKWW
jgi:hypothetical protein